jgi:hypothetical protein
MRQKRLGLISLAGLLILAASLIYASAASVGLNPRKLHAETENVAMCDRNVNITTQTSGIIIVILATVTVSGIDADCAGWTLKVTVVGLLGLVINERTVVVDSTVEVLDFSSLSLAILNLDDIYFAFQPPP